VTSQAPAVRGKAAGSRRQSWLQRRSVRRVIASAATYAALLVLAGLSILPFLWMVSTSLKDPGSVFLFPPRWIPDPVVWSNYYEALTFLPFARYFANTAFITVANIVGTLVSASLAAYAFARLRAPLKSLIFLMILSPMFLPGQVTMIPLFILYRHLNWIDTAGFGRYAVYYAATTPEARQNLNRLGADDVMAALFGVAWGLAQAASFFPIALVWFFPPLVVLALYAFIRAEDSLERVGSRVMLAVGGLLYIASKYVFRPNWLSALPLPRGTPAGLANALLYLAPLLITGIAVVLTWLFVRRRPYVSLLPTFGVFAVSDALLTLLVYVPGILAE